MWQLTLQNLTTGAGWTTTMAYPSALSSAQWAVESDLLVDEFGTGYPLLPNLTPTHFDRIRLNGENPRLLHRERVVFTPNGTEDVVGTPSLPQADGDGFAACAWAAACAVPRNF